MERKIYRKLTIEMFQNIAKEKGGICVSQAFVNSSTKLRFRCSENHEWDALSDHILSGHWCRNCATKNRKKYDLNDKFFLENNNERGYFWAGFIISKGVFTEYKLELHCTKDKKHMLETINDLLSSNHPITEDDKYCILSLHSKPLVESLKLLFHTTGTRLNYVIPPVIQYSGKIEHFLRGFFEGSAVLTQDDSAGYISNKMYIKGNTKNINVIIDILNDKSKFNLEHKTGDPKEIVVLRFGAKSMYKIHHFFYRRAKTTFSDLGVKLAGAFDNLKLKGEQKEVPIIEEKKQVIFSTQSVIDQIQTKGGTYISGEYKNDMSKFTLECGKGHTKTMLGINILHGTWCKNCMSKQRTEFHLATQDEDFFSRLDEKSLYWGGMLASDGCVKGDDNITLAISEKDIDHLVKFKHDTKYTGNIGFYLNSYTTDNTIYKMTKIVSFSLISKKIIEDLAKFNIVNRKTHIYKMPDWLIKHPLVHHFIRGLLDGDGSVMHDKENKITSCTWLGTKELMEQVRDIICENINYPEEKNIGKDKSIFGLSFGGRNITPHIYRYIYKDAETFLERKHDNFKECLKYNTKDTYQVNKRKDKSLIPSKETVSNALSRHKYAKDAAEEIGISAGEISDYIRKYDLKEYIKFTKTKKAKP